MYGPIYTRNEGVSSLEKIKNEKNKSVHHRFDTPALFGE